MRLNSPFVRTGFLVLSLALQQACVKTQLKRGSDVAGTATTTIVVVRHAEKSTDDPKDPSISDAGKERALALSAVLKDAGVAAIYVTQYKRTRQTAEPLAAKLGLSIIERPVEDTPSYAADLAREVLAASAGKSVLIVGHSNTVPQIVHAFSGTTISPILDGEYDHLFIIVISSSSPPRLYNLRFGRATP